VRSESERLYLFMELEKADMYTRKEKLMPTKKTTTRRPARAPRAADNWARNAAVAAHDQIDLLKARLASPKLKSTPSG